MSHTGYGYPKNTQVASYDANVAITNAVGDHINCVRLIATTDCHVAIAKTPVATTSSMYLASGREEYFVIHPGQKVSAIKASGGTAGLLNVTEMTR